MYMGEDDECPASRVVENEMLPGKDLMIRLSVSTIRTIAASTGWNLSIGVTDPSMTNFATYDVGKFDN